jgi:hypothetical protein
LPDILRERSPLDFAPEIFLMIAIRRPRAKATMAKKRRGGRPGKPGRETVRIDLHVPPELARRIEEAAAARTMPKATWIRQAILEKLQRDAGQAPPRPGP